MSYKQNKSSIADLLFGFIKMLWRGRERERFFVSCLLICYWLHFGIILGERNSISIRRKCLINSWLGKEMVFSGNRRWQNLIVSIWSGQCKRDDTRKRVLAYRTEIWMLSLSLVSNYVWLLQGSYLWTLLYGLEGHFFSPKKDFALKLLLKLPFFDSVKCQLLFK